VTDRLIRITTALAVVAVVSVAAIISYQHAYDLVTSHGETGTTAYCVPLTVDGLIWAASMAEPARRADRDQPDKDPCVRVSSQSGLVDPLPSSPSRSEGSALG
jgi:hypothetical protein